MKLCKSACFLGLLLATLLFAVAGVVGEESVINVGFRADPGNLDPAFKAPTNTTWFVYYNVFEQLCRVDKDDPGKVVPVLATSWESQKNAQEWVVTLRQGVTFHDGSPFNAEAVKYTFDRLVAIAVGTSQWFTNTVAQVVIEDTYRVRFVLKLPYPLFPNLLAARDAPNIVSPAVLKPHANNADPWAQEWAKNHPVGTGPYVVTEWVPEQYLTLTAFPQYWRGWEGKHFTKINYQVVREASSRKMGLLAGTLDYAEDISYMDIASLVMAKDVDVSVNPSTAVYFIQLNNQRPPLDNPQVREALSYAFPYTETLQYIYQGFAATAQGPLSRGFLYHADDLRVGTTDLAKAAQLLTAAGFPKGGFTLDLVYVAGLDYQRQIAEAFQANLAQLGVTVELRSYPWTTITDMVTVPAKERMYMLIRYNGPDFGDPFLRCLLFYTCTHAWDWGAFCDPEYEALYAASRETTDTEQLRTIAYKLQHILVDEVANIFFAEATTVAGLGTDIKGYYSILFYPGFAYIYDMYRE